MSSRLNRFVEVATIMIPAKLILQILTGLAIILPVPSQSDQTDARLDELFSILKTSKNPAELQSVETSIWDIWFESGEQKVDVLMEQAGSAVQAGSLKQAEQLYSQVTELVPEFSEGWNRRATVRYYQGDYEGSLEDIQRTLILEPRHFGATWGLGMILGWRRDFEGAIAAFERLLEIKPSARDAKPRIEMLKQAIAKSAV